MVEEVGQTLERRPESSSRRMRLCAECGGSGLMRDYDAAEVVCMACGYVVQEKIADTRPEWRGFDDEQRAKRARAGAPMPYTIHDKGLSTIIDWRDRPTGTKGVSADQRIELYKLRKWQRRVCVSAAAGGEPGVAFVGLMKLLVGPFFSEKIFRKAILVYPWGL